MLNFGLEVIGHVVHYSVTKIVHDCMASLSPVGIASFVSPPLSTKVALYCLYGYFLVFPKKLPSEMKYDCNKDVFSIFQLGLPEPFKKIE
jgi:hypothetical protein